MAPLTMAKKTTKGIDGVVSKTDDHQFKHAGDCNEYSIMIELVVEEEEVEDVYDGEKRVTSRTERVLVACHPEDTLEELRLRLYHTLLLERRGLEEVDSDGESHSLQELIPVGFEVRWFDVNIDRNSADDKDDEIGSKAYMNRYLASRSFSKPVIWYPAKYLSLLDVLRVARIDHDGNYGISEAITTSVSDASSSENVQAAATPNTTLKTASKKKPVLYAHGSPGLPLRAYALAESFGAVLMGESVGDVGVSVSSCKIQKAADRVLFTSSLPSSSCPLTNIKGLVAFHCHTATRPPE